MAQSNRDSTAKERLQLNSNHNGEWKIKWEKNTCCTILLAFSSINLAAVLDPHHRASAPSKPQLRAGVCALCNVWMAGVLREGELEPPG